MAKEENQGAATPSVVPGYGEAGGEAASMDKAAHNSKTHSQGGAADSNQSAPEAAAEVVPDVAGPVGYGTSETDVKKRIADAASREAAKPAAAG